MSKRNALRALKQERRTALAVHMAVREMATASVRRAVRIRSWKVLVRP